MKTEILTVPNLFDGDGMKATDFLKKAKEVEKNNIEINSDNVEIDSKIKPLQAKTDNESI